MHIASDLDFARTRALVESWARHGSGNLGRHRGLPLRGLNGCVNRRGNPLWLPCLSAVRAICVSPGARAALTLCGPGSCLGSGAGTGACPYRFQWAPIRPWQPDGRDARLCEIRTARTPSPPIPLGGSPSPATRSLDSEDAVPPVHGPIPQSSRRPLLPGGSDWCWGDRVPPTLKVYPKNSPSPAGRGLG